MQFNSPLTRYDHLLGLIGYPLSHSFSKGYFSQKFKQEHIQGFHYELFPIESIEAFPKLLDTYPNLLGLNVTVPYKELVIPYLDELDESAAEVGAVNVIKIQKSGKLKGYNSDVYGFKQSLEHFFQETGVYIDNLNALVLGTGGASKAVMFVLKSMNIAYKTVSRSVEKGDLTYDQVSEFIINQHHLIINTTPLGMSPHLTTCPDLDYTLMTENHLLYDLVYNPAQTLFMKQGNMKGAKSMNGLEMLHLQAEKSWKIWND